MYQGLLLLSGDVVPREEVDNNQLNSLPWRGFVRTKALYCSAMSWSLGIEVPHKLTPAFPWGEFVRKPFIAPRFYCSMVTWSPGKKLSTASYQTYLGEGLYKGLVSLVVTWSPGKMLNRTSTQPYLGEGLYKRAYYCFAGTWSP